MELAKNYDEKFKAKIFPGYAQIKHDGVPITFTNSAGVIAGVTRQNEQCLSVPHIIEQLKFLLIKPGSSVTMEILVPGEAFKYSSGLVRRQVPDEETAKLRGYVFDANLQAQPKETYYIRWQQFNNDYAAIKGTADALGTEVFYKPCTSIKVESISGVEALYESLSKERPGLEGIMVHALNKPFSPGKRCWGMCRYKPQPTIDLLVGGFEEAISEDGTPLGMVGRVNVFLRRSFDTDPMIGWRKGEPVWTRESPHSSVWQAPVGVGPGKLNHEERKQLWEDYQSTWWGNYPLYAEIKFMPDESYKALRQPTVQRLRQDKTEGDVLVY
ncbi:ATP-dependent DNA ligase [Agrobacterium phage Alfirin]|nr:ATP-dependent DNA ligase [Agrobacterium phage Alfirin]